MENILKEEYKDFNNVEKVLWAYNNYQKFDELKIVEQKIKNGLFDPRIYLIYGTEKVEIDYTMLNVRIDKDLKYEIGEKLKIQQLAYNKIKNDGVLKCFDLYFEITNVDRFAINAKLVEIKCNDLDYFMV
jgi:hypothetical protein